MLKAYIEQRRREKELLLMTHIVLGYPNFDDSLRAIEQMVNAGVDLMELQIPFSEPMADGPVILKANALALEAGATVEGCLRLAEKVTKEFDIPFLFMTYYNIVFNQGVSDFVETMKSIGIQGAIIPDLPPEEGEQYLWAMKQNSLAPVHIFTPNSSDERMRQLSNCSDGFIYAVARKGVTGKATAFSSDLDGYLERCRKATDLPLAVGFGVSSKDDVDFIRGKADIAVIGSQSIRVMEQQGVNALGSFISGLNVS
mgnify:FL=1|jgi:tryptophan synthase alpha chain